MKDGTCPECGTAEVFMHKDGMAVRGTRWHIALRLHSFWDSLTTPLTTYICTKCGYVEQYIADTSKLPLIDEKWQRVR